MSDKTIRQISVERTTSFTNPPLLELNEDNGEAKGLSVKMTLANFIANILSLDFLRKTNSDVYVPTSDYHPATKKYVDDNAGGGGASITKVTIVAGAPGAGQIQWTGAGPYTVTGWDSGLSPKTFADINIQFFNSSGEPVTPISPDLSDLSSITFNSNNNADLYVVIVS